MMTHHDNFKRTALSEEMSESEEGEIEDDISPKTGPNYVQDNSSDENSEDEGDGEVLDIKPPPATLKTTFSRKSHKHRRHESHKRKRHRDHERSSHVDQDASPDREIDRKRRKESNNYNYREEILSRERNKKDREVREVRMKKVSHENREEESDKKIKDEKYEDIDVKKKEWREKRLVFIEKQRAQNGNQPDSPRKTKESVSVEKDLRDKLREKDRLQRERRLERFRSPPKDIKRIVSTVVLKSREKDHRINPEPTVNKEAMECDEENHVKNGKNMKEGSESDTNSKSESDAGSDTESSDTDNKSEASSSSSAEENEESGDDSSEEESSDSSSDTEEEEEKVEKKTEDSKPIKANVLTEPASIIKKIFPTYDPAIQGCRSVDEFNGLSRIEEGTYGVVYRATEKATGKVVALKRLKMEKEKEGFPITSLREINTLLKAQHQNIVSVREIVVGSNIDRIYIVMDYVEHDLKTLMKTMTKPFTISEVNSLLIQLIRAVAHLHDNWILHRDLKPSNLLLSHKGILKVGDFGLAREYGSPLKSYTPVVVTLWYRAPELLLGTKKYSTAIDMWSVGCIFGELLTLKPLFPGESEMDQLKRVFKELGTPSEKIWPGFNELPLVKKLAFANYPYNRLKHSLPPTLTNSGFDLINRLLTYNPVKRITAENAMSHDFFDKNLEEKEATNSIAGVVAGFNLVGTHSDQSDKGGGFSLKF